MHPTGQKLNFVDRRKFENRETYAWTYMPAPIQGADAPRINENGDCELVEFIDNHIICALPDETKYPERSNFVKGV